MPAPRLQPTVSILCKQLREANASKTRSLVLQAAQFSRDEMCKRVRRTQWIPGPYVHGNVLEHRVVEHASHSALGSKCVRD